ncbi:MAG: hypothetical protein ACLPWF_22545 [Bryobacteraceae bacterium]
MILIRLGPFALLVSMLLLAGCDRLPESYPPPEQRHPVAGSNPDAMMVEMSDPDANLHIVKDVYGPSNPSWRWTAQNPTLQLLVLNTDNLKFYADFAIWDDGFKVTGPLEIAYLVNGRLLDKVRYTTPGEKRFEKPVPADWVAPDSDTTLAMSVDKLYVAPRDGVKFGVILVRMGFKQ